MKRIVIVSGIQPSTNPRVVKEADALAEAGYDVTVLGATLSPPTAARDREVMQGRRWKYTTVLDAESHEPAQRFRWLKARLRMRLWRELHARLGVSNYRQAGYAGKELLEWCRRHSADLYIVHNPQSLWVGLELRNRGERVAVDMEDWYSRDVPESEADFVSTELVSRWERALLPRAAYVTTTSHAMAAAISDATGCALPATVYNSFPVVHDEQSQRDNRPNATWSLIWFSQVIGPGRGLETLIDALARVSYPLTIELIGTSDLSYRNALIQRAPAEWREHIHFSAQVPQSELVPRIQMCDIAYAGEFPTPDNKNLTISNKILLYLQAGLPVVASDTIGHREVADKSSSSVRLFAAGDSVSLGNAINSLLRDPGELWRLREQAKDTAERFFSWEQSKAILLDKVRHALNDAGSHPSGGATIK